MDFKLDFEGRARAAHLEETETVESLAWRVAVLEDALQLAYEFAAGWAHGPQDEADNVVKACRPVLQSIPNWPNN